MQTSRISLDEALVADAVRLGRHKNRTGAVTLEEYIGRKRLEKLLSLEGQVEYFDDNHPKRYRRPGSGRRDDTE